MADNINNTLGIDPNTSNSNSSNQPHQTDTHFKTLLGYGKFISGLGWLLLIIGGVLLLFSIGDLSDTAGQDTAALFSMGGILIGLWLAITGVTMVIIGQTVSCFVAIEKNTRATQELIKAQLGGHPPSKAQVTEGGYSDGDDDISKDNLFK